MKTVLKKANEIFQNSKMLLSSLAKLLLLIRGLGYEDVWMLLIAYKKLVFVIIRLHLTENGFNSLICTCKSTTPYLYLPALQEELIDQVTWAVKAASLCFPKDRSKCLEEAIAMFLLMKTRGVTVILVVGVKSTISGIDDRFDAHAWLELNSEIISGLDFQQNVYIPILSIG
ncbi:lasso peptide biosynthesis B2 protein [Leptolyngbya sp. 7M]|uniref:lasso peptide biosynthesis B2 protein n=1 Tax=Leptolyngbya sp. 7M TaxID=2812896 RepID=UPI001B8D987A|nr:lasso peptide biosynthesis B2 protein [Leptolyngbya sp. 7M]QYO64581.1 lasso peptide biosynthesis B2 protein [Leptolyngbya sp. 7M]